MPPVLGAMHGEHEVASGERNLVGESQGELPMGRDEGYSMGLVESRSILAPAAGQGETPFSGLGARRLGKREARAPPAGGVRDPDAPLGNEGRSSLEQ